MDHPPFPPFCLARLLRNTFRPRQGERVCILIDLPDPGLAKGWAFLGDEKFSIHRHAHDSFYNALHEGVMTELGMTGGEFFAYEETGGSNLDLPDRAVAPDGTERSLQRDVDRKSTRLNSSHKPNSYGVFCLKKNKIISLFSYAV